MALCSGPGTLSPGEDSDTVVSPLMRVTVTLSFSLLDCHSIIWKCSCVLKNSSHPENVFYFGMYIYADVGTMGICSCRGQANLGCHFSGEPSYETEPLTET